MPIYEYYCDFCKHKFEYLVFKNEEPYECEVCNKTGVSRVLSTCSFVSKGVNGGNYSDTRSSSSSCGSCTASSCSGCT